MKRYFRWKDYYFHKDRGPVRHRILAKCSAHGGHLVVVGLLFRDPTDYFCNKQKLQQNILLLRKEKEILHKRVRKIHTKRVRIVQILNAKYFQEERKGGKKVPDSLPS